jgi:hypothetical protein
MLQVGDERFNSGEIQQLYEADAYPLRKSESPCDERPRRNRAPRGTSRHVVVRPEPEPFSAVLEIPGGVDHL